MYAGIPGDKEDAVREKLKAAPDGVELVDWRAFAGSRDKYLAAQIRENAYPDSRTVEGIVALIRTYPGTPFGLTWNGGIAFTYNDYQYAKHIYRQYQDDPEGYRKQQAGMDPRGDPINPGNHLGPLLGW